MLKWNTYYAWVLLDQAATSGANFLVVILLAKFLNISDFSIFSLLLILVYFLLGINFSLTSQPILTLTQKHTEVADKKQFLSACTIYQIIIAALLCAGFYFTMFFVGPIFGDVPTILFNPIVLIMIYFRLLQEYLRRYYFALEEPKRAFISDLIMFVSSIGGITLLYFNGKLTLFTAIAIVAISYVLSAVYSLFNIQLSRISFDYLLTVGKENWVFSKWLLVTALLLPITADSSKIIGGIIISSEAIGVVTAIERIAALQSVVFQILTNVLPVKISRKLHSEGLEAVLRYIRKVNIFGLLTVGPVSLLLIIFNKEIIYFVYGEKYSNYSYLLIFFSLSFFAKYFIVPYNALLRAFEKTRIIFYIYFLVCVITVLFTTTLVSWQRELGIGISVVTSSVITVMLLLIAVNRVCRNR